MIDVAKAVLDARNSAGLTQKQLADLSRIKRQTIGSIERKEHSPNASTLIAIARALHVPASQFGVLEGGIVSPFPPDPTAQSVAALMRVAQDHPANRDRIISHLSPKESLSLAEALIRRAAATFEGKPNE